MAKPTPEQKAFLQSLGIHPPKTKKEAAGLIAYLKNGNGAGEATTLAERIALLEAAKREFVGLLALPIGGEGGPVEVLAILPKTPGWVAIEKAKRREGDDPISPFHFLFVREGRVAREGEIQLGDLGKYYIGNQT